MKKFINVFLVAAFLCFAYTGTSQAHCGKCGVGSENDPNWLDKKMERMTENLGLTDQQAKEIRALTTEKMEKKKAIKAEKMEKIEAVKKEYSEKVNAVLTEEQRMKYKEMKAMKDEKGKKMGEGHKHMGEGHKMMDEGTEDSE